MIHGDERPRRPDAAHGTMRRRTHGREAGLEVGGRATGDETCFEERVETWCVLTPCPAPQGGGVAEVVRLQPHVACRAAGSASVSGSTPRSASSARGVPRGPALQPARPPLSPSASACRAGHGQPPTWRRQPRSVASARHEDISSERRGIPTWAQTWLASTDSLAPLEKLPRSRLRLQPDDHYRRPSAGSRSEPATPYRGRGVGAHDVTSNDERRTTGGASGSPLVVASGDRMDALPQTHTRTQNAWPLATVRGARLRAVSSARGKMWLSVHPIGRACASHLTGRPGPAR